MKTNRVDGEYSNLAKTGFDNDAIKGMLSEATFDDAVTVFRKIKQGDSGFDQM